MDRIEDACTSCVEEEDNSLDELAHREEIVNALGGCRGKVWQELRFGSGELQFGEFW